MNIADVMALLNIEEEENLFVEVFPIDAYAETIRFANRTDGTCIYMRVGIDIMLQYGILMWHRPIADIPVTYHICDGTFGTPDLRDKFVKGAPAGVDPGGLGGAVNHQHTFTGDGHTHGIPEGPAIQLGTDKAGITTSSPAVGTTNNADGQPPYYKIVYIMKL